MNTPEKTWSYGKYLITYDEHTKSDNNYFRVDCGLNIGLAYKWTLKQAEEYCDTLPK